MRHPARNRYNVARPRVKACFSHELKPENALLDRKHLHKSVARKGWWFAEWSFDEFDYAEAAARVITVCSNAYPVAQQSLEPFP